jgi:hypothetical protein
MPESRPRSEWTPDEFRERTEIGRRESRFRFAKDRIEKIVNGAPRLTPEQFAELRDLLPAPSSTGR